MPRLEVKPYCDGCSEFVAETEVFAFNGEPKDIVIRCEHRGLCARLVENLKGSVHFSPTNDPLFKF